MKKPLTLLALVLILFTAGKPGGGGGDFPWNLAVKPTSGNVTWKYKGNGLAWSFPPHGNNQDYPAFVTTTTVSSVLGNLTGKRLSVTYTINETGSPQYVWGGYFSGWNAPTYPDGTPRCPTPANIRFFISTSANLYSGGEYSQFPKRFWWNRNYLTIGGGEFGMTVDFDPAFWSDADGHMASAPDHLADFQAAVANVRQCGIAISGGCFFDVGVAVLSGSGTAHFELNSLTVNP